MITRIFGMLLTGIALAMAVLILIEIIPPLGSGAKGADDPEVLSATPEDINRAIVPPIFRTIEETGGRLAMMGTSEADAVLTLLKNKIRLQQTRANAEGAWALDVDIADGETAAYDIILETASGERILGDETVIRVTAPISISPDAVPADIPPNILPEPVSPELALSEPAPKALILVTAPGGPSRIVQNPFPGDPADGPLSMGPIDYDGSGGVIFSGRSTIPGRVRIYGDGQAIGETQISSAGRWFFIAADTLPVGLYNISAELMTSSGVLSKVSVALTRLPPAVNTKIVSDAPVIVIDDRSWQVRRTLVGGGAQYTAVFNPEVSKAVK